MSSSKNDDHFWPKRDSEECILLGRQFRQQWYHSELPNCLQRQNTGLIGGLNSERTTSLNARYGQRDPWLPVQGSPRPSTTQTTRESLMTSLGPVPQLFSRAIAQTRRATAARNKPKSLVKPAFNKEDEKDLAGIADLSLRCMYIVYSRANPSPGLVSLAVVGCFVVWTASSGGPLSGLLICMISMIYMAPIARFS